MDEDIVADFLAFRKMFTPVLVQIVFWIGAAILVVGGIGTISSAQPNPFLPGMEQGQKILGWTLVLLGPVFLRVCCELTIIIFRIYETLADIRREFR